MTVVGGACEHTTYVRCHPKIEVTLSVRLEYMHIYESMDTARIWRMYVMNTLFLLWENLHSIDLGHPTNVLSKIRTVFDDQVLYLFRNSLLIFWSF